MSQLTSPLTGRPNVRPLETWTATQLIGRWKAELGIDVTPEFRGHNQVRLYECADTGLRFFFPEDIAGSSMLYRQLQSLEGYYREEKWEHTVALRHLRGPSAVLEVGCGTGAFLVRAVDVVCPFQVLEHSPNPLSFCQGVLQLTRPDGLVVLSVPNQNSFLRNLQDILDFPPHHMTRWGMRSLKALASILSLRLLALRREPLAPHHVKSFLDSLSKDAHAARAPLAPFQHSILRRVFTFLLAPGGRRLVTGHTILAILGKPP